MPSKMKKVPNPAKINWTLSTDLVCILLIDYPELDQDDVETYSFKEKVKKVGILFLPSALLLPYTKLAMLHKIDFDNVDPTVDFSTPPKAAAKMTELYFKIMNKGGCTK